MPSVSPEIYRALSLAARYFFLLAVLIILFRTAVWYLSDRRALQSQLRNLPGSGTVGELVVVSGNRLLPEGTYFPVPREGVLGSVRSCDLVIPAEGVRRNHLDFRWQDGAGLLIFPRSGCGVLINGAAADHSTAPDSLPMTHGSFLQVGGIVLRFRVYAALDSSSGEFSFGPAAAPVPDSPPVPGSEWIPAPFYPVNSPGDPVSAFSAPAPPAPGPYAAPPVRSEPLTGPVPQSAAGPASDPPPETDREAAPESSPPRRRRSDLWKEDWSE